MVLQVLHTGVLEKLPQFEPSPVVGVELLQGEGDCGGGLLGACLPQGGLRLETHEGAPIHSHIEEDVGFGGLGGRQLTAQRAADGERNCGQAEGQS